MKKILKNKKGSTMLEMIVGLIMLSIITASASAVLMPFLQTYDKATELAEYNTLLDNLATCMVGDMSEATGSITSSSDFISFPVGADTVTFTVNDGVLRKNDVDVFTKTFYKNKAVSFTLADGTGPGTAYRLEIVITSEKSDSTSLSRTYAVRPLVLNQN